MSIAINARDSADRKTVSFAVFVMLNMQISLPSVWRDKMHRYAVILPLETVGRKKIGRGIL
jgi:hypothetical protein